MRCSWYCAAQISYTRACTSSLRTFHFYCFHMACFLCVISTFALPLFSWPNVSRGLRDWPNCCVETKCRGQAWLQQQTPQPFAMSFWQSLSNQSFWPLTRSANALVWCWRRFFFFFLFSEMRGQTFHRLCRRFVLFCRYMLNPYTIITCVTKSTAVFDNLFIALVLFFLVRGKFFFQRHDCLEKCDSCLTSTSCLWSSLASCTSTIFYPQFDWASNGQFSFKHSH